MFTAGFFSTHNTPSKSGGRDADRLTKLGGVDKTQMRTDTFKFIGKEKRGTNISGRHMHQCSGNTGADNMRKKKSLFFQSTVPGLG